MGREGRETARNARLPIAWNAAGTVCADHTHIQFEPENRTTQPILAQLCSSDYHPTCWNQIPSRPYAFLFILFFSSPYQHPTAALGRSPCAEK
jgi:hypothetical protein